MSRQPRPFRFGLGLRGAPSKKSWVDKVRRTEDLGFHLLTVPDHFIGDNFAIGAGLMAAAEATERIRLATMVANNEFRHPLVLAKEAATLDLLSEGRLELGIGAGWWQLEHDQIGIPFDRPGTRIARLAEAVDVIKGAWTTDDFDYDGRHYRISGLTLLPKPVQRPHPPIALGGGGKVVLTVAAQKADIVHFTMRTVPDGADPADSGRQSFLRKLDWVKEAAGDRHEQIELAVTIGIVARDGDSVAAGRHPTAVRLLDQARGTPVVLLGNTDDLCDQLRYWRDEHGISQYSLMNDTDLDVFAPVVARLSGT